MMKKREFGSSFLKSMGFLLFRMIEMGRCKKTVAEGFFMVKRKGERVRLTEAREGGKNKGCKFVYRKGVKGNQFWKCTMDTIREELCMIDTRDME